VIKSFYQKYDPWKNFRECEIMAELKKAEKNAAQFVKGLEEVANEMEIIDQDAKKEFEEAKKMSDFFADLGREKGPIDPV